MWRTVHSILALGSLLVVSFLALTGAFLAVVPVSDALSPLVQRSEGLSVAEVLGTVADSFAEPDRLERLPSGAVALSHFGERGPEKVFIDIRSGEVLRPYGEDATVLFIKELHRSFMLGSGGRLVAGIFAAIMTVLCLTGLMLLVKRLGGWRSLLAPLRGRAWEKLHAISGRLLVLPLVITAITGFYLTMATFAVIPNGQETPPRIPESLAELDPVSPAALHGLQDIPFGEVEQVVFPIPGDWFDVFSVTTHEGHVFVDQFTGDVLSEEPLRPAQIGLDWVKALHTGDGLAPWAVLVGLASLAVPVFAVSGLAIWLGRRRRGNVAIKGNVAARLADTAVLVGSENGATWGFARHLQGRLTEAGRSVHVGSLNSFGHYPKADALVVLTATYGDGHAPKSASQFLPKVAKLSGRQSWRYAVLGFGDASFPHFCQFAADADVALAPKAPLLLARISINRESTQTFARWGRDLGAKLGVPLELDYVPPRPQTQSLTLVERLDYGAATGTPTAILRFSPPHGRALPGHRPGDLVGIVPPGSTMTRFYSLASRSEDSVLEICVRRQEGGVCSSFLFDLGVGGEIDMFIRHNPDFYPPRRGLILIGAGTGIAPFAGMIRANRGGQMALYWGGRDPEADFLYRGEIDAWLADGRLSRFVPAFSRIANRAYVQDRVREDGSRILDGLRGGAAVMVCGGAGMAEGVRQAFGELLQASEFDVQSLKARRRYCEDIY